MNGNCTASVVPPLPSGAFHVLLNTPPTPVPNGVTMRLSGLLSLSGAPKNPHFTPAFKPGGAGAWMCAATRLSFVSGVCTPVTSILKIVALNDSSVIASLRTNDAVPNDNGRGAPTLVVKGFPPV